MQLHYSQTPIDVEVELPGSKSISNRWLILNEVLGLKAVLQNLSGSKDTADLVKAIEQINQEKNTTVDIGHAGTDMRFLTALLSVTPGEWTLTGSERMKERPVKELVAALRELGAEISYMAEEGFPPLKINGKKLAGGKTEISGNISSQFISALLLISPAMEKGLEIHIQNEIVSRPYIDLTISLLEKCGVRISFSNNIISVYPNFKLQTLNFKLTVEPDWSAASYWFSIVALAKEARVVLKGLEEKSMQGDSVLQELYAPLGVQSEFLNGDLILTKKNVTVKTFEYDFTNCPDIAQTVAVTCLGLGIDCRLTGLSTLKVKETDRILALKNELEKFGAKVVATNNSLRLLPPTIKLQTSNVKLRTYKDHRMAMSFAPLALLHEIEMEDPGVVEKSYPLFWQHLKLAGIS